MGRKDPVNLYYSLSLNLGTDVYKRQFRMHRMEGKKYAEIASHLSVSVKTVEAEMTKALKALKKEIENYIIRCKINNKTYI